MSVNLNDPSPVTKVCSVFSIRVLPSGRQPKAIIKAHIIWDWVSWIPLTNNLRKMGFVLAFGSRVIESAMSRKAWQQSGKAGGRNRKLPSHIFMHT